MQSLASIAKTQTGQTGLRLRFQPVGLTGRRPVCPGWVLAIDATLCINSAIDFAPSYFILFLVGIRCAY